MTTYVLCKNLVPWLCSRSQPGIKVSIRGVRGHLLHTVTFLVYFRYASLSFILSGLIKSTAGSFDTEFDYSEVIQYFFVYKM